jgi:predicted AAA+ superfamily ATPase
MFHRLINPLKSNSFFIFGARGTGKSTWIRQHFAAGDLLYIDLLKPEIEDAFARSPSRLEKQILSLSAPPQWVVIDEVQRVPKLLNVVHSLIESHGLRFMLTGSSARKLKRGYANLLAGRAFVYHLYPLTAAEMGDTFNLNDALTYGTLPKVTHLKSVAEKQEYLSAYALTYLREEIQMEQIVRNLDPFRHFLEIAAVMNGRILNYNKIAKDVGCDIKTIQSYYQILEDTWLGFRLPAFHTSARKSLRMHPKFLLLDLGVQHALERSLDSPLAPSTSAFGDAFENWVILEFFRHNDYKRRNYSLSYFQTHQGAEIDLVLSKPTTSPIAIEIKSSERIDSTEVRALARLARDLKMDKVYYLSRCSDRFVEDGVRCLPWQDGLHEILG